MEAYLQVVKELAKKLQHFTITKIPRAENTSADALAALASTSDPTLRRTIPIECIENPSIALPKGVCIINRDVEETDEFDEDLRTPDSPLREDRCTQTPEGPDDWRQEIIRYLLTGELPEGKWEGRRLKCRAARYTLLDDCLHMIQLLIIGCGRYNQPLNPQVRQFVKSIGMKLETVDSRNAASTYNILNEEGMIVTAALLPYGVTS